MMTRNASLDQIDPSHTKKATFTMKEEEKLRKLIQSQYFRGLQAPDAYLK